MGTLCFSGVIHSGVAEEVQEVIADPAKFLVSGDQEAVIDAMQDLRDRGTLVDSVKGWLGERESHPDSERLNALILLAEQAAIYPVTEEIDRRYPPPVWLRLKRTGDWVTSSISSDGRIWNSLGRRQLLLPTQVSMGIFSTGNVHLTELLKVDSVEMIGKFEPSGKGASPEYFLDDGVARGDVTYTGDRLEARNFGVSRKQKDFGLWFAAWRLTGDGQMTVRIENFKHPDRAGDYGLMIRGWESGGAFLWLADQQSGATRLVSRPLPKDSGRNWQLLIAAKPKIVSYHVGYADWLSGEKRSGEAVDQLKAALDADPVKAVATPWLVYVFAAAKRLDELKPYAEKLTPEEFGKDPAPLVDFLKHIAYYYNWERRHDLALPYVKRSLEVAKGRWEAGAARTLVEVAVKTKNRDEIREAFRQALLLPSKGDLSPPSAALRRQELNDGALNPELNGAPVYVQGYEEWIPRGRSLIRSAAEAGVLEEISDELEHEPRVFDQGREVDYVRLAFLAAAQSPSLAAEVKFVKSLLPKLAKNYRLFPNGRKATAFVGPAFRGWLDEMERLDEERLPEYKLNRIAGMFLCVGELNRFPEGRSVAREWLLQFAKDPQNPAGDRTAAASLLAEYARWTGDDSSAEQAAEQSRKALREQYTGDGEVSYYTLSQYFRMLQNMAQVGNEAGVQEIADLRAAREGGSGTYSPNLLKAEATLRQGKSRATVSNWLAESPDGGSWRFAVEPRVIDRERDLRNFRSCLGRLPAVSKGVARTLVFEGSKDGSAWQPLAEVTTGDLAGSVDHKATSDVRFVRGYDKAVGPELAPVTEVPRGPNLFPRLKVKPRTPTILGEEVIEGWEIPANSSVHGRVSEIAPGSEQASWVSGDLLGQQTFFGPEIPIDPNKRYLLTGWLRSENTGSRVPWFGLRFVDQNGKAAKLQTERIVRTPVWQMVERMFGAGTSIPIPEGARGVQVVLQATYTVDFTGFSLTEQP